MRGCPPEGRFTRPDCPLLLTNKPTGIRQHALFVLRALFDRMRCSTECFVRQNVMFDKKNRLFDSRFRFCFVSLRCIGDQLLRGHGSHILRGPLSPRRLDHECGQQATPDLACVIFLFHVQIDICFSCTSYLCPMFPSLFFQLKSVGASTGCTSDLEDLSRDTQI